MNKDVIYIDVEDDITAIIGKVKDAKEKIVALVPPKRVGVLQSAVNLRLLARAASQSDKHLVLITSNAALGALAAAAKVPVAKNLQSKPEIAEISALDIDNGDDVIDGAQLPVGDHARIGDESGLGTVSFANSAIDEAVRENAAEQVTRATPPAPGQIPRKPKAKSGISVPNFNDFRKKMIIIIAAAVLLIGFLVWAIFFAAKATVIITARTTESSANAKVTLGSDLGTSFSASTIKTVVQQTKKEGSVEFTATGKKEVGEKSQGQVVFKNCEDDEPIAIAAGTALTVNGRNYLTQSAVTVPKGSGGFGGCSTPGTSTPVAIAAENIGGEYNTPKNTTFTVAGHATVSATNYFNAVASTDITGGSKKEVKVVSASDIQAAIDELSSKSTDAVKKQLAGQFNDTFTVLDQSFKTDRGTPQSSPAVDQEVSDGTKPKLTTTITYSLSAVAKSDIDRFLSDYFKKQIEGQSDRRVYENGSKNATFTSIAPTETGFTANVVSTAKIGPKINDEEIKEAAKGKRFGDIQAEIESIQGVDDVDVKFWPFWVSSAPNDTKKISIDFKLNESN